MKRGLTLSAGIIGTILMAVLSAGALFYLYFFMSLFQANAGAGFLYAILIFISLVALVGMVLNIIAITTFSAKHEKYKKKRACIITAIVFNFIALLFLIVFTATTDNIKALMLILVSVFSIGIVITNIFYIIDFKKENKRIDNFDVKD